MLSPSRAAPLVALAFAVTMASTTLPTPLYPTFEAELGFGSLVVTAVYATYSLGVIAALLTLGHVSDRIGRRPVLLAGLAFAAASAIVFLVSDSTGPLFAARILSGLSAGLFTGTATAFITDLYGERRTQAALLATACNIGGLGLGPPLAALAADLGDAPLRVPFWADLALIAVATAGIALAPETVPRTGPVRPRLQRLAVPAEVRDVFVTASIGGFAGFATLGLFAAVAPGFMHEVLDVDSRLAVGGLVALIFLSSATAQVAMHRLPPGRSLRIGLALLIAGALLVALALLVREAAPLVLGAVVAGSGHGLSFKGGMAAIVARLEPEHRGAVISSFFVVLYTALSLPVVGVGIFAELIDLRTATIGFSLLAASLAAISLLGLRTLGREA